MLGSSLYVIIPILLLPLWIMLLEHPWKGIRFIAKFLLFINIFEVITGLTILLIIKLNYWIVLLIVIIIAFRSIDILVSKLDFSKYSSMFNERLVFNITISSFTSILVIFLTLEKSPWFGLWFAFFFYLFIGTGLYKFTQKFKLVYGPFFGFVVLLFPYNGFNVNSIITLGFSFTVTIMIMLILSRVTKRRSDEKHQIIGLGTIIVLSLYLFNAGGIPLIWAPLLSSTFIFVLVNAMLYFSNRYFSKFTMHKVLKHYFIVILMIIVITAMIYYMDKFSIFKGMVQASMTLLFIEAIVLVAGRIFGPIMYRHKDSEGKPYIDYFFDAFILIYGRIIGSRIYKAVYGEYYKEINAWVGFLLAGAAIGSFGTYLALTITSNPVCRTIVMETSVSASLFISFTSSLTFFSEVLSVINSKDYEKGMSEDKAIHSSTTMIANYAMCIMPFFIIKISALRNINIYFAVFITVEILLYIYTINLGLFVDLKEQEFNDLYVTRKRVTIFLMFIGIASVAGYLFCIYNSSFEAPISMFLFLVLVPFVSTFFARLIGYDNEISGEKVHKQCVSTLIFLLIYFITYLYVIRDVSAIYTFLYIIMRDESIAKDLVSKYFKIISFGNIFILTQFSFAFAIAILPKTNNLKGGLSKLMVSKNIKRNSTQI